MTMIINYYLIGRIGLIIVSTLLLLAIVGLAPHLANMDVDFRALRHAPGDLFINQPDLVIR